MGALTISARIFLSVLTTYSTSLFMFGQPSQAQSYPCSQVALGANTFEQDRGYVQNNNASVNQSSAVSGTQSVTQRNNLMDTESSSGSGNASQWNNNSGSSSVSNTDASSSSNSSFRSGSSSVGVGASYAGIGGNVNHSSSSSSGRSNSQSNYTNSTESSDFNRGGGSENAYNSQYSRNGSDINENFVNNSNSSQQSYSEAFNRDRQQNDYTRTSTTVVGINCDNAVQAESERDIEMIRQRGAVEQERVRLQRDEMRQQNSEDFWNRPL